MGSSFSREEDRCLLLLGYFGFGVMYSASAVSNWAAWGTSGVGLTGEDSELELKGFAFLPVSCTLTGVFNS